MSDLEESIETCDRIARDLGPEPELVLPLSARLRNRGRMVSQLDHEAAAELDKRALRIEWLEYAAETNLQTIINLQLEVRRLEAELRSRQ